MSAGIYYAPQVGSGFGRSGVFFMTRTGPVSVAPPISSGWDAQASYFGRSALSSSRLGPSDLVGVVLPLTWAIFGPGSCIERQLVGEPMPPGVRFDGAVLWCIMRAATLSGTVRPWISFRLFDMFGREELADLLPLGEYGSGTNMNANGTRLWAGNVGGGAPLASYMTQGGEIPVVEIGWNASTPATASTGYGSWAAPPAGNEVAINVCSTAAEGVNPGNRAPLFEIVGLQWPP